jgi:hypothetical protein
VDRATRRDGGAEREGHGIPVEDGKGSGKTETDRADVGVRGVTESVGAAAEDLGLREELAMDLEADDRLVAGNGIETFLSGTRHGRAGF